MADPGRRNALDLDRSIGFNGAVPSGVVYHPGDNHIIYPLGSTIVIRELGSRKRQDFLTGHTNTVSAVAVSKSGRLIASGQKTFMGHQADVVVWDFETRQMIHRFVLHKAHIKDLSFSCDDQYLVSLGGEEDNAIVVWDLAAGRAICGSPASMGSSGVTNCVRFLNNDPLSFVSAGQYTLRVWRLDMGIRKIRAQECQLGQLKRVVTCIVVEDTDDGMFCGTTTGDVLHINLRTRLFRQAGPKKRLNKGITALALTKRRDLLVGAGDGTLCTLARGALTTQSSTLLAGAITSIAVDANDEYAFVGTSESNIYYVMYESLEAELRSTCHPGAVFDVAFPHDYSEVFATCGPNDIRLWNSRSSQELVRIRVPSLDCLCVAFMRDGGSVLSGWSDGKIRSFGPESGELLYVINDAHHEKVTAITSTSDMSRIVSGGADGQVRVWRLRRSSQEMQAAMKEHKGLVSSIMMKSNDLECVSSSADGSCIVWDLQKFIRLQVMFASSFFKCVRYHPDESQLLTCGTDRKICYWDVYDGSAIRELELPAGAPSNSVCIFADGERFVSGGADKLVQLWSYDDGEVMFSGEGHSGNILKVLVSPDQREIVSISDDGAIFVWSVPS